MADLDRPEILRCAQDDKVRRNGEVRRKDQCDGRF